MVEEEEEMGEEGENVWGGRGDGVVLILEKE